MTSWKRRRNSWCFPHPVKTVLPHATRKHIRLHQDDVAAWRDQCRVGCNLQVVRSNGRYAGWQAQYRRTLERGRPPGSALGTNLTGNGYIAWDPYYHNIPWPKQICNEKQYSSCTIQIAHADEKIKHMLTCSTPSPLESGRPQTSTHRLRWIQIWPELWIKWDLYHFGRAIFNSGSSTFYIKTPLGHVQHVVNIRHDMNVWLFLCLACRLSAKVHCR